MDLIPLTKNLNLKRGKLTVLTEEVDDELCRFIFNECKDFKRLWLYCETSPDFEISPEQIGIIRNDQFVIDNPWFSMNHVLHCCMNCKKLDLSSLIFSVTEGNTFLRNWIQGSEVGFMHCGISGEVNMEALLEGITSIREPEVMTSLNGIGWTPYSDCFIIEQSNGVKGVVFVCWNNLFVLSTVFELDNGEKYGKLREFDVIEVDDESADGDVFMDEE
ncbi:hypothetical protein CAEBREN_22053 [Caenorhabditis brenneri]|uniref:Sdz-33 F-box domain-containing protein n=1 Tax=Caenorhabditis brenneri TaxID=135651 RepID=G0NDK9_CAEBE|nr:hypothetical protein CAEBREN_22053 [Caenorhabditis brenneri]